jgi:two-component system OmpR family sensor kinase
MNFPIWPRRLRQVQLRTHVLAGVLVITLAALAISGYAAVTALHEYLLDNTAANLKAVLTPYEPMIARSAQSGATGHSAGGGPSSPSLSIPAFLDQYYVQLQTPNGGTLQLVQGDSNLVPVLPANLSRLAAHRGAETVPSLSGSGDLLLTAVAGPSGTLVATTSVEGVDSTISRLRDIVIVGTLAAGLVVFAGAGLVIRRGLRPIQSMAATADKITAGDLAIRVKAGEPETEVGHLAAALNGMLARIQAAADEREASEHAVRQFPADASHELRTPLASLRANAELYQQGALTSRVRQRHRPHSARH